MSVKQLRGRVQHKKKTEAEWYLDVYVSAGSTKLREKPFIPLDGELIVFEKDDTHENDRFKFGDGETNVMELPFTSVELVQADWNQTDKTKADFVKNKTHGYDEKGNVKQLDPKYIPPVSKLGGIEAVVNGTGANAVPFVNNGKSNIDNYKKYTADPTPGTLVYRDGTGGRFFVNDATAKQHPVAKHQMDEGLATKVTKNTSEESKQTVYITDPKGNQSYKKYTSEAYPSTIAHREASLDTIAVADPLFDAHPVTVRFGNERYFPVQKNGELKPFAVFTFEERYPDPDWPETSEEFYIQLGNWIANNLKHGQKVFTDPSVVGKFDTTNVLTIIPDPSAENISNAKNVVCPNCSWYDDEGKPKVYDASVAMKVTLANGADGGYVFYKYGDLNSWRSTNVMGTVLENGETVYPDTWEDYAGAVLDQEYGATITFYDVADYTEHITSSVMIQNPQGNPSHKPYTQFAEHGTIPMRSTSGAATFEVDDPVNEQNPVTLHYAKNNYEVKRGSSTGPNTVAEMEEADVDKVYSWGDKYVRYYKNNGRFNVADPTGSLHPVNKRTMEKYVEDYVNNNMPEIPDVPEMPEILQSDWNQTNSEAQDFIKNRTHYGESYEFATDVLYDTLEDDQFPIINFEGAYLFQPGHYTMGNETITISQDDGSDRELSFSSNVVYVFTGIDGGRDVFSFVAVDGTILNTVIKYTSLGGIKQLNAQYIPIDNETIITDDNGKLKASLTQADQNQNDENQPDYIKNRTHYSKLETELKTYQSSWHKDEMNSDDGEDHNFFEVPEGIKSIRFTQFRFVDTTQDDDYYGENISYRNYPIHKIELNGIPEEDTEIGTYRWVNSEMVEDDEGDEYEEIYEDTLKSITLTSNGRIYLNCAYVAYEIEYEEIKQLDPKYIPLSIKPGEAKNSLQTPNATALTEDSFAAGTSLAGCRGYYIKAIDFANKYLYLSKTQVTTQPDLVPRYIFATHFKSYEYVIKVNGYRLTPIATQAITVGSLSFDVYKTAASKISVTYPNIDSTENKNRTYQFLDWEVQRWQRNEGQTVEIDCSSSIILQYGANYLSDLSEFIMYCQDYADVDDMYDDPNFKTGYDQNAVRGKHFYTINNLHYLTDDDVKGDRDATILSIEGNRVAWTGDIGYDSIMPDPSLAFYDYSFMIPEIPNPSDDAINLKPLAVSIGTGNKNIGRLSFSIGSNCQALQDFAFVGGNGSKANYMDFSFGNSNIANGQYGAVLGGKKNVIKRGAHSAAIIGGMSNTIESNAIRAFIGAGTLNVIKEGAEDAFVSGRRLTANAIGQTVLGRDNVPDASKLFILGGGSEESQINVFTIDDSGNAIATGRVTAGVDPINDFDLVTKRYGQQYFANQTSAIDTNSKIYLVGATSQGSGKLTYSHNTAYVGTDGCLYSGSKKVATEEFVKDTLADTAQVKAGTYGGWIETETDPVLDLTITSEFEAYIRSFTDKNNRRFDSIVNVDFTSAVIFARSVLNDGSEDAEEEIVIPEGYYFVCTKDGVFNSAKKDDYLVSTGSTTIVKQPNIIDKLMERIAELEERIAALENPAQDVLIGTYHNGDRLPNNLVVGAAYRLGRTEFEAEYDSFEDYEWGVVPVNTTFTDEEGFDWWVDGEEGNYYINTNDGTKISLYKLGSGSGGGSSNDTYYYLIGDNEWSTITAEEKENEYGEFWSYCPECGELLGVSTDGAMWDADCPYCNIGLITDNGSFVLR